MVASRLLAIALVGVEMLLGVGCADQHSVDIQRSVDIQINDVAWGVVNRARPAGEAELTRLRVSLNACGANAKVDVSESESEIRLRATSESWDPYGNHFLCSDGVLVALEQPLGDRAVIDASTDQAVRVTLLDPIPHNR